MGRKAKAIDRKDQLSISLRRDEYKNEVKKVLDKASGKDVTDKIIHALKFFNRNEGRKDRTYREDKPENWKGHLKEGDQSMQKDDLIEFVRDQWGEPEFHSAGGPLEERSKPFLKGYVATKLDMDIDTLEDRGIQYLRGFMAASGGKVDAADLRKDRRETTRSDIKELREERLQIGQGRDDKSIEELREERQKLYDGIDEKVEKLVKDKVENGQDEVEALREARFELFEEGG